MRPLEASSQAVFGQHGRGLFRRRGDGARRTLEKYTRKVFPSASRLTYNPLFKTIVDTADVGTRVFFSQFRPLPPNHLRIRVGVGNRIFFNQSFFVWAALPWWLYALNAGWCRLDATIVDIGCGCGRWAMHLRNFELKSHRFTGHYYGIDIDDEMLEWCRRHFDAGRFTFFQSTDRSTSYNRDAGGDDCYRVPLDDGVADFVFSTSLFTHLLEEQLANYLLETYRLLKPGGWMAHTVFCLDHPPATLGGRHSFAHQIGAARVESLRQPEAAVAYAKSHLFEAARTAGFPAPEMLFDPTGRDWQPILLARKPMG